MEANTSQMINLNGYNYQLWKTRMEDLLYVNGFHQPVICSEKPDDKTNEEWKLLHRRVCGYIRQCVDDNILTHVSEEVNARTLWDKLRQLCAQKTCHDKMLMIKQSMNLRYSDGTAMSDHLNSFQAIIDLLSEMGIKIDDEVQGWWLLGTLPDSWESLKTSVLNSTPNGIISVELVKIRLLNEEMNRKPQGSTQYTIIKVARDLDLLQQIGKSIYFDLVDHDKVFSFRILKQIPFALFKEEVAKCFGIPVQCQRFWLWAKRENHTYRPNRPLTPLEEAQSVGHVKEVSNEANNAELKLFLEVELGPNPWPVPPPVIMKNEILLFFKLYDPSKEELRYVGRLFVPVRGTPKDIVTKLNEMAGFVPGQELQLFEEIKFKPVMCEPVHPKVTYWSSNLGDGDIICFQKLHDVGNVKHRYPNVPSFFQHVCNLR